MDDFGRHRVELAATDAVIIHCELLLCSLEVLRERGVVPLAFLQFFLDPLEPLLRFCAASWRARSLMQQPAVSLAFNGVCS